jgi:preprotein translocase subunit SecA
MIFAFGEQVITEIIVELKKKECDIVDTIFLLENLFGKKLLLNHLENVNLLIKDLDLYELKLYLFNEFWLTYYTKGIELSVYGDGILKILERSILLINIDKIWREHLQEITLLREAVGWRGYGQRNPLYEYKQDAFYLFETRKEFLRHLVIYDLLRSSVL